MRAEVGVLSSASGSAIFEMGNTKVLAAVFGPKPVTNRGEEDEKKAIVKCEYAMAVFSTGTSGCCTVGAAQLQWRAGTAWLLGLLPGQARGWVSCGLRVGQRAQHARVSPPPSPLPHLPPRCLPLLHPNHRRAAEAGQG